MLKNTKNLHGNKIEAEALTKRVRDIIKTAIWEKTKYERRF